MKSFSRIWLFATPWAVACTRLLHPWDFLCQSTGVGCHFLWSWPRDRTQVSRIVDRRFTIWATREVLLRLKPIPIQFCSVAKSCLTLLRPHGLQHARHPCPSPAPGACWNPCPSTQWCHPTISSSVIPFSSCFNLSQHQGLFHWVSSSHQVAKVSQFQLQHQSFQWIFKTDFLYDWLVGSPCRTKDSQESSLTPQSKSINSLAISFLYSPTLISIHDYWKTHSFD